MEILRIEETPNPAALKFIMEGPVVASGSLSFSSGEEDDDASVPGSGIYFVTENNLPWAINIPDGFDYMKEKAIISSGYLKFVEWAQSGGVNYPDWFTDQAGYRDDSKLY